MSFWGGMPTEATIAHVLVSKYADHLPLYRQAQIYSRQGIDLDRSTLTGWVGKAAYELRLVFDALLADLKGSSKLFMDETRAPVLDPDRKKTKTGYFWALARDDRPWNSEDPPGLAFTYAPGRSGQYADQILEGFSGILQVDGYAGYNRLLKQQDRHIQFAYCWGHARRKLHEVSQTGITPIADEGLQQIAALYRFEKTIRGSAPDDRLAARKHHAQPIMDTFENWLNTNRARVSSKAPLGEALKYIAKYWGGLCLFLTAGRIELDSNAVERTIRPIALSRTISEEACVADAVEAGRQGMDQEAADELLRAKGRDLHAITMFFPIVFPSERNCLGIRADKAVIGDRHPMRVTAQVRKHGLGAAEGAWHRRPNRFCAVSRDGWQRRQDRPTLPDHQRSAVCLPCAVWPALRGTTEGMAATTHRLAR